MGTKRLWERIIQDRWLKFRARLRSCTASCLCLCALAVSGHAAPPSPRSTSAAGLIGVAQRQLSSGNPAAAADSALAAAGKKSPLDDYAYWIRAQAEYRLNRYDEVAKAVTHVFEQAPASPFVGPAAALGVRSLLDAGKPKEALELVRKYYDQIPEPQGDLLIARSLQADGDLPQAAEYFQRVYYRYPSASEATDAANALVDVKAKLGDTFPPAMPAQLLERAQKLFDANNPAAAKIELAAAINQLGGAERDVARVRLGVADYLAGNTAAAFQYLSALKVDDAEADAERLSYLIRTSRKLDRNADVKPFLQELEKSHPNSLWRLDALIYVADGARVSNDPGTYLPLYQACADTFSADHRASWCHWQITFDGYRKDAPNAIDLLKAQIKLYPDSNDTNDALYFLGRAHEHNGNAAAAKACYQRIDSAFPNTYYAVEARERLKDSTIARAVADPETVKFLDGITWPPPPQFPSFTPGKLAQSRLDRAALLQAGGLGDLAENELKFGAKNDGEQQNIYAFELAKLANSRGSQDQAIRLIKNYAPGYLFVPLDQAPLQFWQLAFPLPFRSSLEQYSRAQGLDPYLVAALIRQESEFNPKVVSHANAYGLMQLLPATGREMARHFGVRRLRAAQLLVADRNIQLGTYFFHNLLNSYSGQPEIALASYNAGPGRANIWRTWGPFREQAEFVESVPFHETRGYVQIVLRNADVYRRLYANATPDVPEYKPKPAPKTSPHRKKHHHT